jgi:hypothetical protein
MNNPDVEREYAQLAAHVDTDGPLGPYLEWVRTQLLPLFAEHDAAAMLHAARHRSVTRFIYITAALVVALVAAQALFLPGHAWIIWGEVLLIGGMLWRQRASTRAGDHTRWLEHRYVAERLRTGVFTFPFRDAAGELPGPRSLLAPGARNDAWARAMAQLAPKARPVVDIAAAFGPIRRLVTEAWCGDQSAYHARTGTRNHAILGQVERWGLALLLVTVAAAVLHALGVGHHTPLEHILTFLALVLPAVSASMNAIKHSMELHKMGLRSENMAEGLARFRAAIDTAEDPATLGARILELERFFLWEHEEWFSLLSFKKADVG